MIIQEINENDYLVFHKDNEDLPVFHRIGWIKAVSHAYSVRFQLLGGFCDNCLRIAFPVYFRNAYGLFQIAGSPLPQIGTPPTTVAISDNVIDWPETIGAIKNWQKSSRILYFQMALSAHASPSLAELNVFHEIVDNLELSLEKSLEDLWDAVKQKSSNVRLQNREVEISWLNPEHAVQKYQELLRSTYEQGQHIKPNFSMKLYEALIRNLYDDGLKLLGATYQGSLVSMYWILYDRKKCYWWDGASDQNISRKVDVSRLLHWEVIKWAKNKGLLVYDLVGRAEKSGRSGLRPGIAKFKKSLGAECTNYIQAKISSAWMRVGISLYRKLLLIKNKPKTRSGQRDD